MVLPLKFWCRCCRRIMALTFFSSRSRRRREHRRVPGDTADFACQVLVDSAKRTEKQITLKSSPSSFLTTIASTSWCPCERCHSFRFPFQHYTSPHNITPQILEKRQIKVYFCNWHVIATLLWWHCFVHPHTQSLCSAPSSVATTSTHISIISSPSWY